jgi:imidazole glycerol phosphate synthase glutamine amidotransferase subunit
VITILDYGAGNLRSVQNTLAEIGADYELVRDSEGLRHASKIILPGVGHFGQMMRALDRMRVREALLERLKAGFQVSEEAPEERGLGLFEGCIRRFPAEAKVPHMGWNEIQPRSNAKLLAGLAPHAYLYFAHSYYAPLTDATAAVCSYMTDYTAVLESANVYGVQFHPEKSGPLGLRIVRNFVEL